MQAIILASGKGTYLRPLTVYTPKPIIPIMNSPLLIYQIELLKRAGIENITLLLDYQPDKIQHLLGDGKHLGVKLEYIIEPKPLGTAGGYKFVTTNVEETTVILNGDVLTDFIFTKAIKNHKKNGSEATVVLKTAKKRSVYDLIQTDNENRVLHFQEKSTIDSSPELPINTTNAGIYIIEPSILNQIAENEQSSFELNVFPELISQKRPFFAYISKNSYWCSIDSLEKYLLVHKDFLTSKIKHFKPERNEEFEVATSAFIDKRSVIGKDCVIKSNAKIINSVLGEGIQIEENVTIENSVIWSHSRISNSAKIQDAIISRSCYIGKNTFVSKGSVLGDKASLTDYTKV